MSGYLNTYITIHIICISGYLYISVSIYLCIYRSMSLYLGICICICIPVYITIYIYILPYQDADTGVFRALEGQMSGRGCSSHLQPAESLCNPPCYAFRLAFSSLGIRRELVRFRKQLWLQFGTSCIRSKSCDVHKMLPDPRREGNFLSSELLRGPRWNCCGARFFKVRSTCVERTVSGGELPKRSDLVQASYAQTR